jgi:signal transduction histidine kinase
MGVDSLHLFGMLFIGITQYSFESTLTNYPKEREMKRKMVHFCLPVALVLIFLFLQTLQAKEMATREECIAKVNEAVQLIQKEGIEPSLKKIMDKDGPFVWKDSYVFCIGNQVGKTLAHPITNILGFPMKRFKDEDGKQPFVEVIEVANKDGNGWIQYNYRGRGENKPRMKSTYFAKVPGKDVIVCAGYYE